MKRSICFMALSSILFSAVSCGETKNTPTKDNSVDVVIISGQSNAVGCTKVEYIPETVGFERYQAFLNGYPEIQIAHDCWTKDWPASGGVTFYPQNTSRNNNFVKTALGQGNGLETFGPEIGIAEEMHERYANKLYLIKFACGGSNLKDDWLARTSPMYPKLIQYVKNQMDNLVKKGLKPTIKAFCWMQGEGDSYSGYYQVYQDNLRSFVSNIRTDLRDLAGNMDIPFIDAGISDATEWQYYKEVNAAKAAFAEESPNNIYIDTIAAGMHTNKEPTFNPDICHYDSDSEILLGHLFAQAFEPFLKQ